MPALVSVVDVSKSFGPTHALRGVSLDLRPGEIHALVGENGAGKSTLIKVMTGLYRPDAGHLDVDGETVELRNPADCPGAAGSPASTRSRSCSRTSPSSENIFMGQTGRRTLVRWRDMHAAGGGDPRQLEVDVDPRIDRLAADRRRPAGGGDRQGDVRATSAC